MVKIDLITGFLGSGKTTFIKKYAKYLIDQGLNIGILENDFGAVNVDMMLLQDIAGEKCTLEMVAGGCDKDCHRRRFRTKLIAMGMCGYDIVLLSKAQEAAETDIERTKAHLNKAMESVHCDRRFEKEIFAKDWNKLSDADFKRIQSAGYVGADYEKKDIAEEDAFQSLYFMNLTMPVEKLEEKVKQIFNDKECGNIFRIKGFMQPKPDQWIELNATHQNITIQPIKKGQEIFIVIGEKLNKEKINTNLMH